MTSCAGLGARLSRVQHGALTPWQDAMRRDLTINALFYNVELGLVEDFTGRGITDMQVRAHARHRQPGASAHRDPTGVPAPQC